MYLEKPRGLPKVDMCDYAPNGSISTVAFTRITWEFPYGKILSLIASSIRDCQRLLLLFFREFI